MFVKSLLLNQFKQKKIKIGTIEENKVEKTHKIHQNLRMINVIPKFQVSQYPDL